MAAPSRRAYPWRGRITCSPAAGFAGTPDKTAAARRRSPRFVGAATPGDFAVGGTSSWNGGPADWGFRRMILHYAHLCAAAGGVDAFLIGSEMRGLTTMRDAARQLSGRRGAGASSRPTCGASSGRARRSATPPTGRSTSATSRTTARATSSSTSTRSGPTPTSTSSASTTTCRSSDWRDGVDHPDAWRAAPAIYDRAYLQRQHRGRRGLRLVLCQRRRPRRRRSARRSPMAPTASPGCSATRICAAGGRTRTSTGRAASRAAAPTAWVPRVEADLVHRARLPADRQGHEPAERLLRPEVVGELHAATSRAAGATT